LNEKETRMIFSGAQTGGHIYPAIALARELSQVILSLRILFVGSGERIEMEILKREGFEYSRLSVGRLKGMRLSAFLRSLISLPIAFVQSLLIILRFRPHLVIGFGGYSSGPVLFLSSLFRIKTAVCEQNSIPGFTNRILGKFVAKIFIAFENSAKYFPEKKVNITGNPIRREIAELSERITQVRKERISNPGIFTILIFGGSQGAHFLNSRIPSVMKKAGEKIKENHVGIRIVHQTGETDYSMVCDLYKNLSIAADVKTYIHDMHRAYEQADLVIARAGAGTINEITALGLPSILIPFPYASDNHQEFNAKELENKGAAIMVLQRDFHGEMFASKMIDLIADREKYRIMAESSWKAGKRDAGKIIAGLCRELIGV
jgi:UDP-N-acetylglucosamine--N-acetylmuramyl-(pentapeptide) pyrophosphoryl-undecaprenol N-acetylglucosamine transferase